MSEDPQLRLMNDLVLRPVADDDTTGCIVVQDGVRYRLIFNPPGTTLQPGDILFERAWPDK